MNKKITAVLLSALMVLTMFTALVPSASAATIVQAPYEFIGVVNASEDGDEKFVINATSMLNPSILYYDLDDGVGAESLYFNTTKSDPLQIKKGTLNYSTGIWEADGKKFVAWLGEKYFVVDNTGGKWIIADLIVDEDDTDDHLLRVGETLTLAEGWSITALEIDVDGKKSWMSLSKDGEEISNKVVKEYDPTDASSGYFVYEKDLKAQSGNTEVMNFTVDTVFAGMNTNLVKIKDIDLISTSTIEIKNGNTDVISDYKITTSLETLTIKNDEDISLTDDGIVDILGGRFAVRVTKDSKLCALVKVITIEGDGVVTPTKTATPTATATEVGTEDGTAAGTEDGTAAPTEVPTEVPTEEPTDVPGFEAVFAVAGLLAVAYLVLRQRD